jgi:hypothetical protein
MSGVQWAVRPQLAIAAAVVAEALDDGAPDDLWLLLGGGSRAGSLPKATQLGKANVRARERRRALSVAGMGIVERRACAMGSQGRSSSVLEMVCG